MAAIEIGHGRWSAQLRPDLGGAFTRLRYEGIDLLRPTPGLGAALERGAVRNTGGYPMLPWCNRIRDGRLQWRGRTYALARNFPPDTRTHPHPLHGIGWLRSWSVDESTPASVRLSYVHPAHDESDWPFAHRGWQSVSFDGDRMTLELGVRNDAREPMPAGLGWHPFFCFEDGARICCPVEAFWHTDDDHLPIACEHLPVGWRFAREPQRADELELDHCFTGWTGAAQFDRPAVGLRIALRAAPPLRHVVLYRRAGVEWLAIEPMSHMTDAFNRAARGEQGTGAIEVAPGESASATIVLGCERQ